MAYERGEVLWTVKVVAEYLSVTPKTIYRHIKAGTLFAPDRIVRIGKDIRIPRDEVFRIAAGIKSKIYHNSENNAQSR